MKNELFDTKEQYLSMRKAWADYFNIHARPLKRNSYGNKIRILTIDHFFFYAIVRGKDPRTCFHSEEAYVDYILKLKYKRNWYFMIDGVFDEDLVAKALALYKAKVNI